MVSLPAPDASGRGESSREALEGAAQVGLSGEFFDTIDIRQLVTARQLLRVI
jgi:hypothetical protein